MHQYVARKAPCEIEIFKCTYINHKNTFNFKLTDLCKKSKSKKHVRNTVVYKRIEIYLIKKKYRTKIIPANQVVAVVINFSKL